MYVLHTMLLPQISASLNLCLVEDFAVVCGVDQAGQMILPTCLEPRYTVPCGVDGLPYVAELGREGGRFDFLFPAPVVAYVVATASAARPVPQLVAAPIAPPPAPEPFQARIINHSYFRAPYGWVINLAITREGGGATNVALQYITEPENDPFSTFSPEEDVNVQYPNGAAWDGFVLNDIFKLKE